MNPFCTSSGSLLSPTAPLAGLAGLPTLQTPRPNSGLLVQLPKSFPRQRGLGAQRGAARSVELTRPATTVGGRQINRTPVSSGALPATAYVPRPLLPAPGFVPSGTPSWITHRPRGGGYRPPQSSTSQQQASQMPDEPDFAPFTTALEQAAELGLITPSQVSQYQTQAEQSNLGQLQALTAQLNTLIASSPTAGMSFFPSRRRGIGAFPRLRTPSSPASYSLQFERGFTRRRGMGAGSATGEKVGAAITSAAAAAGPAAPIVAAVGVLTSLISSFIGGGCGQACVIAAQAEQIYEYAAQCLDVVAQNGMIGQAALQSGLETFLSAGTQHMQSLPQDSQTAAGLTNMTNALNSDLSAVGNVPATATTPLDLSTVQSLFPSTSGWYAASATAGAQLALAYLQSVGSVASASGTMSILGATLPASVTVAGMTVSTTTLLLVLALAAGGVYFFGGDR